MIVSLSLRKEASSAAAMSAQKKTAKVVYAVAFKSLLHRKTTT